MKFQIASRAARLAERAKGLSTRSKTKITIIIIALLLAFVPPPAGFVERFYSNGFYPMLRDLIAPIARLISFALVDVIVIIVILGLPAWGIIRIVKAGRGHRLRAVAGLLFNALAFAAVAFLCFHLLWGLNYSRVPVAAKLDYDEERLTPEAIKELKRTAVERLNAEYIDARASWPDENEWRAHLLTSFNSVAKDLGNSRGIEEMPPKTSVFDFYLTASGIEGFVNPFGYEVILDSEVLPFEKPFLLAHEWGHVAGFADESEASFVGLLACLRSDLPALRYSGWLAMYQLTPWPVSGSPEEIKEALRADPPPRPAPEVMADLEAIRERARKHQNSLLARAQWKMYDSFLKANRVRAGILSYGRVIRLVVSTRFDAGWSPAHRD